MLSVDEDVVGALSSEGGFECLVGNKQASLSLDVAAVKRHLLALLPRDSVFQVPQGTGPRLWDHRRGLPLRTNLSTPITGLSVLHPSLCPRCPPAGVSFSPEQEEAIGRRPLSGPGAPSTNERHKKGSVRRWYELSLNSIVSQPITQTEGWDMGRRYRVIPSRARRVVRGLPEYRLPPF